LGSKKPLASTGKVVSDYSPLFKYWELALKLKPEEAEKIIPRMEDVKSVEEHVGGRKMTVEELKRHLVREVISRVDPSIAQQALGSVYGVEFSEEEARMKIADIVAGWIIEVAEFFGIVDLKTRET